MAVHRTVSPEENWTVPVASSGSPAHAIVDTGEVVELVELAPLTVMVNDVGVDPVAPAGTASATEPPATTVAITSIPARRWILCRTIPPFVARPRGPHPGAASRRGGPHLIVDPDPTRVQPVPDPHRPAPAGPVVRSSPNVVDMCRNITVLRGLEPPASTEEVEAAARQYVRKVGGVQTPSPATAEAFDRAVRAVATATADLLAELPPRRVPPRTDPPLRRRAAGTA